MIAKNAENAMVCDPVACAEALRKIFYLLRLAARPGSDIAAAAINMLHGNLPRRGTLVPEMRVRNRPGPVPPIPIQPDGWVGTPIRFGGNRAPSAAFAAIWGLQKIVLVLPDAALPKDDAAWQDYPWVRILRTDPFLAFDRGSLADLYEQAEDLLVAVQSEATQRAVAAAPVEPVKGLFSPAQLADQYKLPVDAVKKRLERYREKNHNGWIENMDARPREPRFTYDHDAVRYILEDMKSKESRKTFSSRQRPAKKI